jgi:hypothetical protein
MQILNNNFVCEKEKVEKANDSLNSCTAFSTFSNEIIVQDYMSLNNRLPSLPFLFRKRNYCSGLHESKESFAFSTFSFSQKKLLFRIT